MRFKVYDLNDISDDIFVFQNDSVGNAVRKLENSTIKTLLVINQAKQLEGTLTDGDVRRCLLKGYGMDAEVHFAMNTDCFSAPSTENYEFIRRLMSKNSLNHLPIINKSKMVEKIVVFDRMLVAESYPNDVLIMAGGEGRRLLPLTEDCPKPMLTLNGKPMLEHVIDH